MKSQVSGVSGMAAGAAAGGLVTGIEVYIGLVVFGGISATPAPKPADLLVALFTGLPLIPLVAIIAAIVFTIGLVIVGLPAWAVLLAIRVRSRWAATGAGAFLAALTGGALLAASSGGVLNFPLSAMLILPGAAAGWTLHRVAYGRTTSP